MTEELDFYKKKLLYRASYRGSKEMDILLGNFVEKNVDKFSSLQLRELEKFLRFEDETIFNFYNYDIVKDNIDKNEISSIFKKFNFLWRRVWDSNPRTSCPVAGFQDQCFQQLSHLSNCKIDYFLLPM